jgi:hypothetical protein
MAQIRAIFLFFAHIAKKYFLQYNNGDSGDII